MSARSPLFFSSHCHSPSSQDDPLKLGVDLEMFNMGGNMGGAGSYEGPGDMNMNGNNGSAGSWHREHYGINDDDEEDDDDSDGDDDFMFHGPNGGGGGGGSGSNNAALHDPHSHHHHEGSPASAAAGGATGPATFDAFSQRQNFTSNGFDLSTGEVVVASFADFASFDDDFRAGSASPDSFAQPVEFDDFQGDFANFAEFESAEGPTDAFSDIGDKDSAEADKSEDAKTGDVDFAPSEF